MTSTNTTPHWSEPLTNLLHARQGPLTRELLLEPAKFGLGRLPERMQADATTTMVCGFCSTGCGLKVHLHEGEAVGLSPTVEYPVNLGMACPKGWEALAVLDAPDRATTPLLKNSRGVREPVSWETAITTFVSRLKAIQAEHGPESVAFLSTGQMPTEEMALLGAVFKFGMGFLHADANTRQCMATAAVAYKQSFGFDAPPFTYQDFEESDVLIFVGANPCIAHPIMWERVLRNQRSPEIVVLDPRRTETAMQATWHIALAPKGDLALLQAVSRILCDRNALHHDYLQQHTTGFEEYRLFLATLSLDELAAQAGVTQADLERFADLLASGKRVSFWWTMGINQSYEGVRAAQAMINLCLMTGNIGKPGTGPNSITGQCNAMGSRIFSNTTGLPGGRDFLNPAHRTEVATLLNLPLETIPTQNSLAYSEILEGILSGKIKALWVIATNPAHSWCNQSQTRDILSRLEFLAVQDMYHSSETAQQADVVFPAAGWGEKEGTFINSERRVGVFRKVRRAPGQALSDFSIVKLVAAAWGCGDKFRDWSSPEATFGILQKLSAGRPCDITGIRGYRELEENGGVQWPYPANTRPPEQQRRLFADGQYYTPSGKANFLFEKSRPMPEPATTRYPLILLTGRGTVAQWHTNTRTRNSAVLRKLYPQNCYLEMNPLDAAELSLAPQSPIIVRSQRGEVEATLIITPTVAAGQVFMPMHYETMNRLTDAVFDPYSKQPSYKACAVQVERR